MKKIVFTGPESSGKTTLTKLAAALFNVDFVPEYARDYLKRIDRSYQKEDLLAIAKGQLKLERKIKELNPNYLFCDTSFLVLKIWSEYKYGHCDPQIIRLLRDNLPDIYFLCGVEIPWEPDPLRENRRERKELYIIYKEELEQLSRPFFELKGSIWKRMKEVYDFLDND